MKSRYLLITLISTGCALAISDAHAQVAGSTTTATAAVMESTRVAMGWSAKKSILGKTVRNEGGESVGKVEDLIVAPDQNVSYLIVGAGGFVGIGRHDVAVPVSQIQNVDGQLVMAGATKDSVKAMPRFEYADEKADRTAFLLQADRDISQGKADIDALERKAQTATGEAKKAMAAQLATLKADLKTSQAQLASMKSAAAVRWKEFEAGVRAANVRLRQAIDKAMG